LNSSKKKNNVAAIIPFYNERRTINTVISQTLLYVHHVIAVNDGSIDDSLNIITESDDITLISFDNNIGKGSALEAGLKKGVELGYKYLVTIDADLQHNPREIPFLLNALDKFDIVIGNRLNNLKGMPFQRILSNRITSFLLSIKTGQKLVDSQCGFRAYISEVIKNVNTRNPGYEAESEMLIMASRKNYKIGFVNISTIYGNEKSKMNPYKTTFGFIKILFI
jgi:glycosyltransferase involved in cell wall biosynthesis